MFLKKHFSANNVDIQPFKFRRELAMAAYIIENPKVLELGADGFDDVIDVREEVSLIAGRADRGTNGRVDLLVNYGNTHIGVVELKLDKITTANLSQLESYLKERQQIASKLGGLWDHANNGTPKWIGLLIGNTIDRELTNKLCDGHYFDGILIAGITINRFKEPNAGSVYVVSDTYFVEKVRNNDQTKYNFRGTSYGKGKLVLAVMKAYEQDHPGITFGLLEQQFPHRLQGKETFTTEIKAQELYQTTGYKRHYLEPEDLVPVSDAVAAVSSQWGLPNIGRFIEHARLLGFDIQEVR
ncbi:MAG: hypothetical protein IPP33_07860 [Flavobacteriales bacterium]|nr:hypothetical protein [Flavobacteriales bacterium]